jgi:hypothetical protein
VTLIGAIFVSPLGASASGAAPAPAPGPHNRAFAPAHAPKFPASSRPRVVAPISCDGQFHVTASTSGTGNSYLEMVSPVNANDVWAVGIQNDTSISSKTLAEHWNGSTWSTKATVSPSANHNSLFGVSAVSSSDVWAVGAYTINNPSLFNSATLAEHWNGTSWIKVATPNPSVASYLFAVTAVSSTSVWAVGTYFDFGANAYLPLVEHYNGSSWTASFPPGVGITQTELFAVSALNDNDIWAVGSFENGGNPLQDLAAHWDGASWTMWNPPDTGSGGNEILGVTALESGHAVGVGYGSGGSPAEQAAAWDLLATGTFARVDLPASANDNLFNSVARSSGSVWAVGFDQSSTMVRAATWDPGTHTLTWAGAPGASDNPSGSFNDYFAVAAISPSVFWATGFETSGTTDRTLAELHCDLALGLSAPATAAASQPFSVTVTAKNPDASTKTSYDGTVHFTSSDALATLPTDYTFVPADAGVHAFSGVVLVNSHNQPSTITVSDKATPFITATATVTVSCVGACQSPAGTPGSRGNGVSPAGVSGGRGANQSPAGGAPGIRIPSKAGTGVMGPRPASIKPAAPSSSSAPSVVASYRSNTPGMIRVRAAAVRNRSIGLATRSASAYTFALAGGAAPVPPSPGQPPWYLLLLLPPLMAALVLLVRLRLFSMEAE